MTQQKISPSQTEGDHLGVAAYQKRQVNTESPLEIFIFAFRKAILLMNQILQEIERKNFSSVYDLSLKIRKIFSTLEVYISFFDASQVENFGNLEKYFKSIHPAMTRLNIDLNPSYGKSILQGLQQVEAVLSAGLHKQNQEKSFLVKEEEAPSQEEIL